MEDVSSMFVGIMNLIPQESRGNYAFLNTSIIYFKNVNELKAAVNTFGRVNADSINTFRDKLFATFHSNGL